MPKEPYDMQKEPGLLSTETSKETSKETHQWHVARCCFCCAGEMSKKPFHVSKEPFHCEQSPFIVNRALTLWKEPYCCEKSPIIYWQSTTICQNTPCQMSKEPYHSSKESCQISKEPCNMPKEPYQMSCQKRNTINILWIVLLLCWRNTKRAVWYGVATISGLLKIIGLFCKI